MKKYVIVVAGGKGLRMGSAIPKQFLEVNGKAIILHTLEKFKKALPMAELFLVLPKKEESRWKSISRGTDFEKIKIAFGGKTRFDSVKSGLKLLTENGVVGIHDAVRPAISEEVIKKTFSAAEKYKAVIPVVELKDSLRKLDKNSSEAVDRSLFRSVQTPQCFTTKVVLDAYNQPYYTSFTDDASVVEKSGVDIHLVEGNKENIKVTTQEDLAIASFFLSD